MTRGADSTIELYCTYFDHNYLRKGLALYLSLKRHSRPSKAVLAVLALSERCEEILRQLCLPNLIVIPMRELETNKPELLSAKANRSKVEYYFTLTPWLIKTALDKFPTVKRVTYLDSDLYFFSSPSALWNEAGEASMIFIEHRFSPGYLDKIRFGKFNVSWNTFTRDPVSQKALQWWCDKCLEWCYDRIEGEKYADQGYLTILEKKFGGVHILQYPGINIAEYNADNLELKLTTSGPKANNLPVIYWHMHCLLEKQNGDYVPLIREDLIKHPVINWAYTHYTHRLISITGKLQSMDIPIDRGNARYTVNQNA